MSNKPIPVAVIGAGNMGANHVRVYDELPEAELVTVVEPDDSRAEEIGRNYDLDVIEAVDALPEVDAVSVCVPNEQHRTVAESCLERGFDILVEKPLALDVEDARAIVEAAESSSAILQVGHIERFNPAIATLAGILETEKVIALESHRLGPFNEHLTEESVVFDLMIHDLDVIQSLLDSSIDHLEAIGAASRSTELDHAVAQFKFVNGILGSSTASHVTHGKVRRLGITTQDAFITLDYQEQNITIQRRGTEQTTRLRSHSGYRTETVTETPYIRTREPLKNELEHFLECVAARQQPSVTGEDGVSAVRLASRVVERIYAHGAGTET